ncbi:metal-dependent transcriptional regulator [Patescibacteria group bacterium]|nr:metal-dependent transcriptional regulator [Patescibacteria group bacterium]MBU0964402.1 metal-dependent transcriptional regulator [Patescibacteria group bacterium]
MVKQNQEDYLRAIYNFWEHHDRVIRSVDIAGYLNISKASVSQMLKKLAQQRYVKIKPYSYVLFTTKGLALAKRLMYKHRIIEVFLREILGINKKNVHEEANRLEHGFSDETIRKLAKFINNPKYCPGGKKIPKL